MKFGSVASLFEVAGSTSKTSKAAPPSCPFYNASYSASSSITPPLDVLIILAVFFMDYIFVELIICFVLSNNGTCSET